MSISRTAAEAFKRRIALGRIKNKRRVRVLRAELEVHVSQCPNCFVVLDTTKRTLQIYRGMEPQDVPDGVRARLMAALEKRMAARRQG